MKKYIIVAIAVLCLASCGEKKFHVEGSITNAKDSVLYFENIGINDITVVDSVKLDADGELQSVLNIRKWHQPMRLRVPTTV